MSDDSCVELQQLLDRFSEGGAIARRDFLERAVGRLRLLAAKVLGRSFPALKGFHDIDSVVNETWMRLLRALETTQPQTVQEFLGLAAHKIRQVLLDMVERSQRIGTEHSLSLGDSSAGFDPSQVTFDPVQLMIWGEFHQRVAMLDGAERQVFEMHYYLEIPQTQIAVLLKLPRRQVSRLWVKATDRLTDGLAIDDGMP